MTTKPGKSGERESGMLECDSCHKRKSDVKECHDPYAKEINDEIIETQLCDSCYQEHCDDI